MMMGRFSHHHSFTGRWRGGRSSGGVLLGGRLLGRRATLLCVCVLQACFRGGHCYPHSLSSAPSAVAMIATAVSTAVAMATAAATAQEATRLGDEMAPDGVTLEAAAAASSREEPTPTLEPLPMVVELEPRATTTTTADLFSPEWETQYALGDQGCNLARGSYTWRPHGFGSNINNMLNAWVYALAVEHWADLAVIIDDNQMNYVECSEESMNQASWGWDCLFIPMPHLCTFPADEDWQAHMVSKNVNQTEVEEATRLDLNAVRFHSGDIVASLDGLDVDHLGALALLAKYLWSNFTPWLQADIDLIAHAPVSDAFDQSPFLGLHVRRGDKVELGEAELHTCEEYLDAAVVYLEGEDSQLNVEDIKGIWVASDDDSVVQRLKEVAPGYLPNVDTSNIYWASGGVEGGPEITQTATRTDKAVYADFAYTLADLQRCATADVFVGTFSSNMGRLIVLLRESIGLKSRDSAISIDSTWFPGRRRRRRRRVIEAHR